MSNFIQTRRLHIEEEIRNLQKELVKLQGECKHELFSEEFWSWGCAERTKYYVDKECTYCGKRNVHIVDPNGQKTNDHS